MDDEIVEVLMDKEQIERLPRFHGDNTGIYQDNQRGLYVLRDDVLGCFALYLGGTGHD